MTRYPDGPLDLRAELYLGGAWVDVTGWAMPDGAQYADLTGGTPDGAQQPSPASLTVSWDNPAGMFSPRNALGPWYGLLRRNVPCRVSVAGDGSDRDYRLYGELASIVPAVDSSGANPRVQAQMSGLLRRVQQGAAPPVMSAMKRGILLQSGTLAPVAYWPCEDGAGAASLASALGGPPVYISGSADLAADSSFACSAPLPQTGGATWRGQVPAYTGSGSIICRFLMRLGGTNTAGGWPLLRVVTTGTSTGLDLRVYSDYELAMVGGDANSNIVFSTGLLNFAPDSPSQAMQDQPCWVSLELRPGSPGQVNYAIVIAFPGTYAYGVTGSYAGTVGQAAQVIVQGAPLPDTALGHISVQSDWASMYTLAGPPGPLTAWENERAGARFTRILTENAVPAELTGTAAETALMGPQPVDTLWALLQEVAAADGGLLYDSRAARAIGYRTLASMLNQAPAAVLDYAAANLPGDLSPADDDLDLVNDWTAVRADGSSARAVLNDGSAMSAADPAAGGSGAYASTAQVNVPDAALPDAAGWRLRQSTIDEARYRQVRANAGIDGAPVADLAALRIGDLIEVRNPPALLQTGTIRQIVTGAEEILGPGRAWTWDCVPASGFDVIALDTTADHIDTDGSSLAAAVTASATALSVATPGALWSTAAADYPADIVIEGERITVTAVSGASSPQAMTVTRAVNGVSKAHPAGADVRLQRPPILSLILGSGQ